MKRRSFLAALAGLPLVGRLIASRESVASIAPPKVNEDRFYWIDDNGGHIGSHPHGQIVGYVIDVIDEKENRYLVKLGTKP